MADRGPPPDRVEALSAPTFGFVVIGDYGSGNEVEAAVADDVEHWVDEHRIDALVTTGDNVYPEGESRYFDEAWSEPYGWVSTGGLRVVPSLGNHDFEEDGGEQVMDLLDMPGPYYEVDLRDADIFVLDSNRVGDEAQFSWFHNALDASERQWQVVVFHHPAFSCSKHGSTPEVIERWVPLFERLGVDLVLNGHDHNYQRFAPRNGVTYVVTGGGGDELYPLDDCEGTEPQRVAANDDDHHFVAVTGTASRLRVDVIAEDESVVDRFALSTDA